MNKEEKMKLLEKLVKEGHITLCEAFHFLEVEKEYIYPPYPLIQYPQPTTTSPYYNNFLNPTITC